MCMCTNIKKTKRMGLHKLERAAGDALPAESRLGQVRDDSAGAEKGRREGWRQVV
jgi:hypothetical protein